MAATSTLPHPAFVEARTLLEGPCTLHAALWMPSILNQPIDSGEERLAWD